MNLQVKCPVTKEHLIWAVSYLRANNAHGYVMKREVLEFLREQFSQFGTRHCFDSSWEEDYAAQLPFAKSWVQKRYPYLE